jgi:pyruvate dehydrogenase E1 component alpha subunit
MVSMLPDMMAVAVGMAFAFKLRGEERCALSFFGDGATSVGDWHEAMNFAGLQQVPVIFVLEHNGYAYSTPSSRQFAVDPLERASVYGIAGVAVDGNDVEAVFEVTRQARERALAGGGPTLIAAYTMRMHGHGAHDDASYVPREQFARWEARDPLECQRVRLRALGVDVDALEQAVRAEIDLAAQEALAMPAPDPAGVLEGVFCEREPQPLGRGAAPWSGFTAG